MLPGRLRPLPHALSNDNRVRLRHDRRRLRIVRAEMPTRGGYVGDGNMSC